MSRAFMMEECLVYISLLFVVLGVGYLALDRCIDHALVLRRNADDIASALHAGERWRADVRAAGAGLRVENADGEQTFYLPGTAGGIAYRFSTNTVLRRTGDGPWTPMLVNVKSSSMEPDPRKQLTAWRWELELKPRAKASVRASRIRPLFTFLAVPAPTGAAPAAKAVAVAQAP